MVQVIAHRGARSIAPENTLKAARIAHETGADLWETDVNITRDGRLILFHDDTLLRCTDVKKKFPLKTSFQVDAFDLKEIRTLDAGSYFIETDPFQEISKGNVPREMKASFIGEPIPLLEEGLLLTLVKNWKINLELKYFPKAANNSTLADQTIPGFCESWKKNPCLKSRPWWVTMTQSLWISRIFSFLLITPMPP
jgi:glycerophosphoryl diester phosphodiesterase